MSTIKLCQNTSELGMCHFQIKRAKIVRGVAQPGLKLEQYESQFRFTNRWFIGSVEMLLRTDALSGSTTNYQRSRRND